MVPLCTMLRESSNELKVSMLKGMITVTRDGKEIWKFLVIRPGASSGARGSGIEIKYAEYKKKRVLNQGHVPIVNVRYDADKCGPYRDWQYRESMFEANGNDVAPGIRICNAPAKTILDSDANAGNYRGVAIYVQDQEVVLVSEMEAGWYRYISEWRFHTNGTILPRFGSAAVRNGCICNIHHHHVYWRLDFDIEPSNNNLVEEFNDPILVGDTNWHKRTFEIKMFKDASRRRKWRVCNARTGANCEIIPGANDGVPDSFSAGDLWVFRHQDREEMDGLHKAEVWYGAHFTQDINLRETYTVGPTLRCAKW